MGLAPAIQETIAGPAAKFPAYPTMEMINGTLRLIDPNPPGFRRKVATINRVPWRILFIANVLPPDPVNDD
jgi:hypothetical protein